MARSKASSAPESEAPAARSYIKLGQVLIQEKVITKKELRQALARQKTYLKQEKQRKTLGHTLVEMGITTEENIVKAFNNRYHSNFNSLADDLDRYLRTAGIKPEGKRFGIWLSIKAKLSIAVILIIWLTILGLSFMILSRQRDQLYDQTVKTGKVSLNYIANNSNIPLLNENVLRLNTLVRETASVEGVKYALILDRKEIVQAHTDPSKIRKKRQLEAEPESVTQEGDYEYVSYTAPDGARVLEISTPVTFKNKLLGKVSVGVSLDFISERITQETLYILAFSLLIIVVGVVIAIVMGASFSRPISELAIATHEIGLGNLKYKINKIRNDELGDLANAFNFMSDELLKKAMMQDSFGKYVGSEVLDMIMVDPENAWLKGTRSSVSVLFTDVRGFTSYSENREPEAVVEALNEYFDIATRKIHEFGGYVDKFIGDAVMGVFGVPIATKKHAEQAVRSALAIQKELFVTADRTGNDMLKQVGIGINSGFVVSGNIGSQDKLEYTVIGDTVNVASRLNGLAKAGETVVSRPVLDATPDLVNVKKMPPQSVKGKAEKLEVFKVLDIRGEAASPQEDADDQSKVS